MGIHCWLTYVTSDDSVKSALVLARSLRLTRTTCRIGVIISKDVTQNGAFAIRKSFDDLYLMDETLVPNSLGNDELRARIFAFSLEIYRKCIFLQPNSIVLENNDVLFTKRIRCSDNGNFQTFLFTPNLHLFMFLLNDCKEFENRSSPTLKNEGNGVMLEINSWLLNNNSQMQNSRVIVDNLLFMKFCMKTGRLLKNELSSSQTIFEVSKGSVFDRMHELEKNFSMGLIEKVLVHEWLKIDKKVLGEELLPRQDINRGQSNPENESIAIIGISCRFPAANNMDEFRNLLFDSKEGIGEPPTYRWRKEHSIFGGSGKERKTNAGFLSCPVDDFDAKFFGISPKDAVLLDPQARLLHEVLWESLEDSGIDPLSLHGSHTGIFTGSWMYDYKDIIQESPENDFFRSYMGNSIGATAARLSFNLGITGPCVATESGCSSSIVAVDLAIKSLRNRETNLAIAGGVNLLLHPFQSNIIDYVIAPDGRCKTFDAKADGFGRAEGCGVLVLKRLSDALNGRDNIWALIRGSAVSQEGLSRSLGTPTVYCEALAMELALKDAGVSPEQVTFVETHGTGTRVGDPMEVAATARAYSHKARKEPLIIGSVKTNVGHTESCSGITGIIKTVLSMHQELIPKHLNFDTLNPNVNLDSIPARLPVEPIPWRKFEGQPRLAGVSSFGITGTDGHVILQEAPNIQLPRFNLGLERPLHLLKFSAKTSQALDDMLQLYGENFKLNTENFDFVNAAYTANTGRATFGHRAFLLANTYEDAVKTLQTNKVLRTDVNTSETGDRKICFLFTGQGSQYEGMAKSLYGTSPVFRFHFDQCESFLRENYNLSICGVLWGDGKSKELSRTIYSQTSIFCVEYCLLRLWESWGIKPDYVLGHSLGEFCAAVAAGILSFEDALKLVAERSRLIDNLPSGSMFVIKASRQEVESLMKGSNIDLDFAAVNSAEQTVVAGDTEKVMQFFDICKKQEIKAIVLEASHAFHSRHMDPVLEEYRRIAETVHYSQSGACEYISGMEGKLVKDSSIDINADYWVRHTREKVSFLEACEVLKQLECEDFLEIGPHPVLSTFVMQNIKNIPISCCPSLRRTTNEWETILTSLGKLYLRGSKVDWEGYDKPYIRKKIRNLPFYPFNRKSFWVRCKQKVDAIIHPLIGHAIANASIENIFQNDINLKFVPYMRDHVLGNTILFPGAGFTEMCLSGGYCAANMLTETLDKPTRPVALENVKIEAPLALKVEKFCRLQTIVSLQENNTSLVSGFECKIFHHNENEEVDNRGKRSWILHASAVFHPLANTASLMEKWNPDRMNKLITTQEPSNMDEFYKTVNSAGFMFRDHFRTLQRHWFIPKENGTCEIVAEMNVPADQNKYLLHPLVIDGMILTVLLSLWRSESGTLRVPVRIENIVLLNNIKDSERKLFLHCIWEGDHHYVWISTEDFKPVAVLKDIAFIETNVKTILSVLEQQNSKVPDSWEEIWRPIQRPHDNEIQRFIDIPASNSFDEVEFHAQVPSKKLKKHWIFFLPEADPGLEKIAQVITASGINVTKILPSSSIEKNEDKIVSAFRSNASHIECVIFAWGMIEKMDNQQFIALPFLHVAKMVISIRNPPKLYVLTKNVHAITPEVHINFNPSAATLFGMAKSLKNEHPDLFVRCIDIDCRNDLNQLSEQILFEFSIKTDGKEMEMVQVAYRDGIRYEPRFNKSSVPQNPNREDLQLPQNTDRYQLVLPESRIINDLKFDILEETSVEDNEVEVMTKAYGLNFRDLFSILKPTKELEALNAIGLDLAGVVTNVGNKVTPDKFKVGDRVFAANFKDIQLPSHLVIKCDEIHAIPENMSFAEAATLPLAFSTGYHCLINVAKLIKGETVLIHTGSGGVGLAAIQIAKHFGAKIIATAGSPRKRAYLRSLGIQHVFHSRDTTYKDQIMQMTDGSGVDIILNSMTGPGFKEATLDVCTMNGRFVEMSKMAVWRDEEVKKMRPDVIYNIVDLNQLERPAKIELIASMKDLFNDALLEALPYVQFDALRIKQAFQYFQKAKHIGKVVVTMPEINILGNQWEASIPLFNGESTYVITGGLGGIGFEVCKWMLTKGATDIVLIGRTQPIPELLQEIDLLNIDEDVKRKVCVILGDVGDEKQCKFIFDQISTTCKKPIRGIHHCAGVLCDGLYETQTWKTFSKVYNSKIQGTWNIHNLTKHLLLEHFVLYSSISALAGTPAQANYSSANCFEDAFAHYRYSKGLPATTINWGQWSQIGCAKELNIPGLLPVSIKRMLNGLEEVLRSHRLQVTFAEFENFGMWNVLCPSFKHYMDEKLLYKLNETGSSVGHYILPKSDQFWQEMDEMEDRSEKMDVVMSYMKKVLRSSLRMDDNESLSVDANLRELGVDSLLLVELKNNIQSLLGSRLLVTASTLKDCNTIRDLATSIINKLYDESEICTVTPEELKVLINSDCILEESIKADNQAPANAKSMNIVLLTGCTGQLGPYVVSCLMNKKPSLEKIICLIRIREGDDPKDRLVKAFNMSNLLDCVDMDKIQCVIGDMALPKFGLSEGKYKQLAETVDSVIHLAVKSNHIEEYRKRGDEFHSDIRSVNVGGTLNILRFASTAKTKYVYYASSIMSVIFGNSNYEKELSDDWPDTNGIDLLVENKITGYPISKFVCEMLLKQACDRGIPCKLFRFPWITGDSRTGQINYINNHYILRLLSYLKVKAMPASPLPALVLPVDICADLSVNILLDEEAPNELYNIVHPQPQLEVEFAKIAKEDFNVDIELVDWSSEEFMKKLYANGMPLESLQDIYEDVDRVVGITTSSAFKTIQGYYASPKTFFQNKKVDKFIPGFAKNIPSTMEIIKRDLKFVKSTGFLKQFGL